MVDSVPNPVTVGRIKIGKGQPLALIAGPCVMEPGDLTMRITARLVEICMRWRCPWFSRRLMTRRTGPRLRAIAGRVWTRE